MGKVLFHPNRTCLDTGFMGVRFCGVIIDTGISLREYLPWKHNSWPGSQFLPDRMGKPRSGELSKTQANKKY